MHQKTVLREYSLMIIDNNSNNNNSRLYRILQLNTTSNIYIPFWAFWHMRIITREQNVIKNLKYIYICREINLYHKKEEGKPNLGIYSTSKYLVTLDKKFLLALANHLLPIVIDWC